MTTDDKYMMKIIELWKYPNYRQVNYQHEDGEVAKQMTICELAPNGLLSLSLIETTQEGIAFMPGPEFEPGSNRVVINSANSQTWLAV